MVRAGEQAQPEDSMANQGDQANEVESDEEIQAREAKEMRLMWIGSGVIVLLILGLMGANWLMNPHLPPDSTEMSSQSRTTPAPAPASTPAQ
jgi:hypothetical protein